MDLVFESEQLFTSAADVCILGPAIAPVHGYEQNVSAVFAPLGMRNKTSVLYTRYSPKNSIFFLFYYEIYLYIVFIMSLPFLYSRRVDGGRSPHQQVERRARKVFSVPHCASGVRYWLDFEFVS